MDLISIKTLDDLAVFIGRGSYLGLRGLIYPSPKYRSFKIKKKSGGERTISVPQRILRDIQSKLAKEFQLIYGEGLSPVNAFLPGRGIVKNALPHVGRGAVIRFDLQDFFPTINFGRIQGLFQAAPFNFPRDVASVLAQICCYENQLPQGAPTSPILSNFVAFSLDKKLIGLARRYKARYTRYSDDLTFSFRQKQPHQLPQDLITELEGVYVAGPALREVIAQAGFTLNDSKTKVSSWRERQMVTGIIVNKSLSLPGKFIAQIRQALYVWDKHGYKVVEKAAPPVLHRRQTASGLLPKVERIIRGKLLFLRMVKGASDPIYQKLALHFNRLATRDSAECVIAPLTIDPVVISSQDAFRATWFLESKPDDADPASGSFESTAIRIDRLEGWITCAHCVGSLASKKYYKNLRLYSSDWKTEIGVQVVKCDWDRDLAVLMPVPGFSVPENAPYFKWAAHEPTNEARVATIGFPSHNPRQPPIYMRARVVRVRVVSGISRIEIDKQIQAGNSGGALFDESYRVVGIVQERASLDGGGSNSSIYIGELFHLLPKP